MVWACTGLPPGELTRSTTTCVFLSLNAACSAAVTFSALASVPGAISPLTSTIAVCFLPTASARPFQSTAMTRKIEMYAKVSSLKKMPHRRARRCSLSAAVASFVTSSRSHGVLVSSFIGEPREIDHAVAFLDPELHQRDAVARPAKALPARRIVDGAVRRAYQIASFGSKEFAIAPVELQCHVRAAVEIAVRAAAVPHHERGRRLAEILDLEAHAAPGVDERPRGADEAV